MKKDEKLEYLPALLWGTDSAVQLLNLAENMFLYKYPMSMERVTTAYIKEASFSNKLGQNKGSAIVDLPPLTSGTIPDHLRQKLAAAVSSAYQSSLGMMS